MFTICPHAGALCICVMSCHMSCHMSCYVIYHDRPLGILFPFLKIFGFLDQDGNGVIEVDDLVALHGIMGEDDLPYLERVLQPGLRLQLSLFSDK